MNREHSEMNDPSRCEREELVRRALEQLRSRERTPPSIPADALLQARRLVWAAQAGVPFGDIERELSGNEDGA